MEKQRRSGSSLFPAPREVKSRAVPSGLDSGNSVFTPALRPSTRASFGGANFVGQDRQKRPALRQMGSMERPSEDAFVSRRNARHSFDMNFRRSTMPVAPASQSGQAASGPENPRRASLAAERSVDAIHNFRRSSTFQGTGLRASLPPSAHADAPHARGLRRMHSDAMRSSDGGSGGVSRTSTPRPMTNTGDWSGGRSGRCTSDTPAEPRGRGGEARGPPLLNSYAEYAAALPPAQVMPPRPGQLRLAAPPGENGGRPPAAHNALFDARFSVVASQASGTSQHSSPDSRAGGPWDGDAHDSGAASSHMAGESSKLSVSSKVAGLRSNWQSLKEAVRPGSSRGPVSDETAADLREELWGPPAVEKHPTDALFGALTRRSLAGLKGRGQSAASKASSAQGPSQLSARFKSGPSANVGVSEHMGVPGLRGSQTKRAVNELKTQLQTKLGTLTAKLSRRHQFEVFSSVDDGVAPSLTSHAPSRDADAPVGSIDHDIIADMESLLSSVFYEALLQVSKHSRDQAQLLAQLWRGQRSLLQLSSHAHELAHQEMQEAQDAESKALEQLEAVTSGFNSSLEDSQKVLLKHYQHKKEAVERMEKAEHYARALESDLNELRRMKLPETINSLMLKQAEQRAILTEEFAKRQAAEALLQEQQDALEQTKRALEAKDSQTDSHNRLLRAMTARPNRKYGPLNDMLTDQEKEQLNEMLKAGIDHTEAHMILIGLDEHRSQLSGFFDILGALRDDFIAGEDPESDTCEQDRLTRSKMIEALRSLNTAPVAQLVDNRLLDRVAAMVQRGIRAESVVALLYGAITRSETDIRDFRPLCGVLHTKYGHTEEDLGGPVEETLRVLAQPTAKRFSELEDHTRELKKELQQVTGGLRYAKRKVSRLVTENQVLKDQTRIALAPRREPTPLESFLLTDWGNRDFQGLGQSKDLPAALRATGKVRNKGWSKSQAESEVMALWHEKDRHDRARGHKSLLDFLWQHYHKRFGVPSRVAEATYNLLWSCKRYSYAPDLLMFQKIATGELSEDARDELRCLLMDVRHLLQVVDKAANDGHITGFLNRTHLVTALRGFFKGRGESQLAELAGAVDTDAMSEAVDYMQLVPVSEEGGAASASAGSRRVSVDLAADAGADDRQGIFVEVLKMQHLEGVLEGLQRIESALVDASDDSADQRLTAKTVQEVVRHVAGAVGMGAAPAFMTDAFGEDWTPDSKANVWDVVHCVRSARARSVADGPVLGAIDSLPSGFFKGKLRDVAVEGTQKAKAKKGKKGASAAAGNTNRREVRILLGLEAVRQLWMADEAVKMGMNTDSPMVIMETEEALLAEGAGLPPRSPPPYQSPPPPSLSQSPLTPHPSAPLPSLSPPPPLTMLARPRRATGELSRRTTAESVGPSRRTTNESHASSLSVAINADHQPSLTDHLSPSLSESGRMRAMMTRKTSRRGSITRLQAHMIDHVEATSSPMAEKSFS